MQQTRSLSLKTTHCCAANDGVVALARSRQPDVQLMATDIRARGTMHVLYAMFLACLRSPARNITVWLFLHCANASDLTFLVSCIHLWLSVMRVSHEVLLSRHVCSHCSAAKSMTK